MSHITSQNILDLFNNLYSNSTCSHNDYAHTKNSVFYVKKTSEKGVTITFSVPGFEKNEINLKFLENKLNVEGKSLNPDESFTDDFSLSFSLYNKLDGTKTVASMKNGLLNVFIPYKDQSEYTTTIHID